MRATEFEFRHRWWFVAAIFAVGFFCYTFDHVNISLAVARWLVGGRAAIQSQAVIQAAHAIVGIGALLVILAAAVRTWGTAYLRSEVVHDPKLHVEVLVADGPYRHVRNPLYLGTILLFIGFATMASRTGFVILIVAGIVFHYRIIFREESELLASRGSSYRAFLAAVPRLWPSLKARVPASRMQPQWRQAWLGESFLWLLAAAVAVYAATLEMTLFYAVLAAAFIVRFTVIPRVRSREAIDPELRT